MVEFIEDILDTDPKKVEQNLKMYNRLFNENKTLEDCNISFSSDNDSVVVCGGKIGEDNKYKDIFNDYSREKQILNSYLDIEIFNYNKVYDLIEIYDYNINKFSPYRTIHEYFSRYGSKNQKPFMILSNETNTTFIDINQINQRILSNRRLIHITKNDILRITYSSFCEHFSLPNYYKVRKLDQSSVRKV